MSTRASGRGRVSAVGAVVTMTLILVSLGVGHRVDWDRWYPALVLAFVAGAVGGAIAHRLSGKLLLNVPAWLRFLIKLALIGMFLAPVLLTGPTTLAVGAMAIIGVAATAAIFWPEDFSGRRAPHGA